jgi:hypothetical protein
LVAPEILLYVPPDVVADCHWNEIPDVVEKPVRLKANEVVVVPLVGVIAAVPAVGVPLQGVAEIPVTGTVMPDKPPPVMVTLPE